MTHGSHVRRRRCVQLVEDCKIGCGGGAVGESDADELHTLGRRHNCVWWRSWLQRARRGQRQPSCAQPRPQARPRPQEEHTQPRGATGVRYAHGSCREGAGTAAKRSAREQAGRGEETARRCRDRRALRRRRRGGQPNSCAPGSCYREGSMR